jgi:tricorn protease
MKRLFFILLFLIPSASIIAEGKEGYYRYPAIHDNTVVFTAEGDLWKVDINGGVARRLTTHHGMEVHPEISPDGREIAFSAQYEGPTEIYTMPIEGGLPTRRTYEGGNATVIGWTSQHQILYRTTKYSTLPNAQLVVLDSKNNKKTLIPLAQASDGMYDPTGKTLFFTRLPFQGSQTKRYMGGTVQNLWEFTTGETEAKCLTPDYSGTSKQPLIWLNRIYFISDRDGTMNIWSMKEDGSDLKQHTFLRF